MTNPIGQTLLNQFRVDSFVASGGMGIVYRIWDLKRNTPLAMKVLHAELAEDPSVFKRFKREANALKKLTHPNIVPFYGLYQTLDFAFLLEHFVDGPSLKEILHQRRGQPLTIAEALIYLKALCAALGYAHANGVVHCDVKPGNVMVDRGGRIYLTDFGIARHAESTTTTLGAAGTPAYMTPEQILGKSVTPATDVYALSVILFEMLTGQRPFRGTERDTEKIGSTVNERIRYAHLHLEPPAPHTINATISPDVGNAILKALRKDPVDRFHSVADFFEAVCSAAGVRSSDVASQITLSDITPLRLEHDNGREIIPPSAIVGKGKMFSPRRAMGLGVALMGGFAVVAITAVVALQFFNEGGIVTKPPTEPHFQVPPATYTLLPTYTPYPTSPPQNTPQPPSPTINAPATLPSASQNPTIRLRDNSFCRRGPGTGYEDVTDFSSGQSFPIIGQDSDGWWLVKINLPAITRRKACWIYGDGHSVAGSYSSVPYMEDFEVGPEYNPP